MGSWLRTAILIVAMAIVGFLGVWLSSGLFSARGGLGPTIMQSISPITAIISIVVTILIASVIGGLIARIATPATGMFVLGFAVYAMAMMLEGVTEFVVSGGNLNLLILEALLLAVLVYIGTIIVYTIGIRHTDTPQQAISNNIVRDYGTAIFISVAILPIVLLIAASPMKGQIIGTTMVGGIVVGVFARIFTPSMQPVVYFSLPIAMGGIGYFVASMISSNDITALHQGTLSALFLPMPMEYAAGSIMGVAIGLGWAASLAETSEASTT